LLQFYVDAMKKTIPAVIFILFVCIAGISAQSSMSPWWLYDNHYLTDKYIVNPAFSGIQYNPKIFASTQRMAVSLRDAPAVHLAGAHGRLIFGRNRFNRLSSGYKDIRNAVGGMVFADYNGPFQNIGLKLDYAYIVPVNQKGTTLSFGLGAMLFSKRFNLDNYYATDPNDPLINASIGNNVIIPDINAGVLLSHDHLYVGLSVSQLLENSFQSSKLNYTPAKVYRNFYLLTGYRLVYKGFELEPSIAAGHNFAPESICNNGNFIDLNLEFYLKPLVFALSYRIDGYISSSFQYRVQHFELGIRIDLLSTNSTDARMSGFGVMASYTF